MSACFWLLLVPTFDFIWLLLVDAIALATKLQLQLWWPEFGCSHVHRTLPWWWMGHAVQHAESVSEFVCPVFSHQSLLLVLTTCFLKSFLPSHLPKPQPVVRISSCKSPHTLNCCSRGMPFQKVPYSCVSVLWCIIDTLACAGRHLCEQKAGLEPTEEIPWYLNNIWIYANR